jgi:hypothetical protein
MSNKPHLRPHPKKRHASRVTRLLVAILVLAVLALAIALEMTGHVVFRGRLILLRGGRWLLIWGSLACEPAELASFFGQVKGLAFPRMEALGVGPVNVSAVEDGQGGDADDGSAGALIPLVNCALIARKAVTAVKQQGPGSETAVLTWTFAPWSG